MYSLLECTRDGNTSFYTMPNGATGMEGGPPPSHKSRVDWYVCRGGVSYLVPFGMYRKSQKHPSHHILGSLDGS